MIMNDDLHGRNRISVNMLSSWGALSLQIVSGFIVPRLIDSKLGQDQLGVWDLSWTFVAYFGLIHGGVASSINRYVAHYNSTNDAEGINRVVSTITVIMGVMGVAILAVTAICCASVPWLFGEQLSGNVHELRWVVASLGASMAIQVVLSSFGGVLTGFHRWDLHNGVYAISNIVTFVAMLFSLICGWGLIGLGISVLVCEGGGWLARWTLAYNVFPGLRIHPRLFHVATAREMILFGGKTFVPKVGELFLNQTVSLCIVSHMGPASLALFSRPRALIGNVVTLLNKSAMVLVPTISSMNAVGETEQIRKLLVRASTYSNYLCLPVMLSLGIMGKELLFVWMGSHYSNGPLIMAMVFSQVLNVSSTPFLFILSGLNLHGRPGLVTFIAQGAALALSWAVLSFSNFGLFGVALTVGIPLSIANGLYIPWYACRKMNLNVFAFFWNTWRYPIILNLPLVCCLVLIKHIPTGNAIVKLLLAATCGSIILVAIYWRWVLPVALKSKIFMKIRQLFSACRVKPCASR